MLGRARAHICARPRLLPCSGGGSAMQASRPCVRGNAASSEASPSRCIRPDTCSAAPRSASRAAQASGWCPATTNGSPIHPAPRSSLCAATRSSPKRATPCRSSAGTSPPPSPARSSPGGRGIRRPRCCSATRWERRSGCSPRSRASPIGRSGCTEWSSRSLRCIASTACGWPRRGTSATNGA